VIVVLFYHVVIFKEEIAMKRNKKLMGTVALCAVLFISAGTGKVVEPQELQKSAGELQFTGRFLSPALDGTSQEPIKVTALKTGKGSNKKSTDEDLKWEITGDNTTSILRAGRAGRFRVEWFDEAGNIALATVITTKKGAISIPENEFWPSRNRIRIIRNQADLDAVSGYNSAEGKWSSGVVNIFPKDIASWKAADTGAKLDGIVIAKDADVKLFLPGELIPSVPGMTAEDANTFYVPAGKFLRVRSGGKFQLRSGLRPDDYDKITLLVGGVGTSSPKVSAPHESSSDAESFLNNEFQHAIEIEEGGLFILGSDLASATDKTGGLAGFPVGRPDDSVLILADGKSFDASGKPSNYAGSIKIDGEFRVSCAGGAGVAKIWTINDLTGNGTTIKGKGKMAIYGKNAVKGAAIFAINLFDRGEFSNGMETIDVPYIEVGTMEIIADGIEGIYNPDGTVDGSPGYRNNANSGFYYVGGVGTIKIDNMIVKSTHTGVTADSTVALANFNTAAGILGGVVTDHGPTFELKEVEIFNAAAKDTDGPLSAIYTVQGTATATVTGTVKVSAPNGGAAAIVSTGHGRWTGPEKTKSTIGSVQINASGKNAFFQSNTFDGYGTYVSGDVTIRANNDGSIASFVGKVPPGPDMGKGGTKGQAPEAEDVRDEQFVVQGGEVSIDGNVVIENRAASHYALFKNTAKTSLGSLSINGIKFTTENLPSAADGKIRIDNTGTLTIRQ
jgi:hypothetical protein